MPENHFNAFFIGISINWYKWSLDFTLRQLQLWNDGIRDVRIHDATFTTAEQCQRFVNEVI